MTVELGLILTILSVVVAILGYQLNKQNQKMNQLKEVKSESHRDARLQAQLEYISKGVDDIRIDLKANERQMIALGERVTRVEESSKQAHKRLDALEKEMNYNG